MSINRVKQLLNSKNGNRLAHNVSREIYIRNGFPLPSELEYRFLYINHSRKAIKRRNRR